MSRASRFVLLIVAFLVAAPLKLFAQPAAAQSPANNQPTATDLLARLDQLQAQLKDLTTQQTELREQFNKLDGQLTGRVEEIVKRVGAGGTSVAVAPPVSVPVVPGITPSPAAGNNGKQTVEAIPPTAIEESQFVDEVQQVLRETFFRYPEYEATVNELIPVFERIGREMSAADPNTPSDSFVKKTTDAFVAVINAQANLPPQLKELWRKTYNEKFYARVMSKNYTDEKNPRLVSGWLRAVRILTDGLAKSINSYSSWVEMARKETKDRFTGVTSWSNGGDYSGSGRTRLGRSCLMAPSLRLRASRLSGY